MHVQATSQPSTTGSIRESGVCDRCSVRLSRNNLDDVCRPCSGRVITTDAARPDEGTYGDVTSGSRSGHCPAGPLTGRLTHADLSAINGRLAWIERELAVIERRCERVEQEIKSGQV